MSDVSPETAAALARIREALAQRFYREAREAWAKGREAEEKAKEWRRRAAGEKAA